MSSLEQRIPKLEGCSREWICFDGAGKGPDPSTTPIAAKECLEVGLALVRNGLSTAPPTEDGQKMPFVPWKQYQDTPPTEQQVRAWYKAGRTGVGAVTGVGGLESFEFDCRETYQRFLLAAEAVGLGDLVTFIREGYEEDTPGGGVHWLYICNEVRGNTKLAERPHPTDPIKRKTLIETRGQGGYVILAPSNGKVHPSGGAYRLRLGGVDDIVTLTSSERDALWDLARTFNEVEEKPAAPWSDVPVQDPGGDQPKAGKAPGADFDERATWAEILEPHGWKHVHTSGETLYWRRPGKDTGWSATTGHCKGFKVFSTSTSFTTTGTYTKFGTYTHLNHGGDYQKAVRALAQAGYGTWIDNDGTERPNPPPMGWKRVVSTGKHVKVLSNFETTIVQVNGKDQERKRALSMAEIAGSLKAIAGDWPKRVEETLFFATADHRPVYLNSAHRLIAWADGQTTVDWSKGSAYITQERFFEHLRMSAPRFDAIETLPHWPPIPGIYYMHRDLPPPAKLLEKLIDFFQPATALDQQLIRAMILTLFWGGSPGSRPAFLVTGPDQDPEQGRGVGKSQLCQIIAEELAGGFVDVAPTDAIADVKTRLLSTEDGRKRVVRLDNVKTHKFSWADLEGLITSSEISGRALYVGEGRRPNTLVWMITLNGATLSKDMAQRCVIIKLGRPTIRASWEEEVKGFIRANLWGLLADIRQLLEMSSSVTQAETRWAAWERDVLGKVKDWRELQPEIRARQQSVEDDDDERSHIIEFFSQQLEERSHFPDEEMVFIPALVAAEWVSEATRTNYATNRASAFLGGLSIPRLRKSDRGTLRGWVWTGVKNKDQTARKLNDSPAWPAKVTR
jgi:hypothetical protein